MLDKQSLSCEILDAELKTLCVLPYEATIAQGLRHRCVALLVLHETAIALGGKPLLDLPFFQPVAAGQAAEDTAKDLANIYLPSPLDICPVSRVALSSGALVEIFRLSVSSPVCHTSLDWINWKKLPFLAERSMLGPIVSQLLTTKSMLLKDNSTSAGKDKPR